MSGSCPEDDTLAAAADAFGVQFQDPRLLRQALSHPSADSTPGGSLKSNQRLEFLGDRVLGLIIAEELYAIFPKELEGPLARRFAALVSAESLTEVAKRLDMGTYLIVSRGEEAGQGRCNPANLADACEALIGALYLDSGLVAAADFVKREWADLIAGQDSPPNDPKTALQEWAQARGMALPVYTVVARTGPAHAPTFEIRVALAQFGSEIGIGSSKRQAERAAAAKLLTAIEAGDVGATS